MPFNIKLTKPLTKPAVPDCTPEKGVTEYFKSRNEEGYERKEPEWDVARYSPATELIAKQRDLVLASGRLAIKSGQQKGLREQLDKLWEELREEENALRQTFIKFDIFVKENQEKRDRAARKAKEERRVQVKRAKEIKSLKDQLRHLNKVKAKMQKHVRAYKIYEVFLENVAAETTEFQSVYDIVTKYQILTDTRALLAARQVQDMEEMEQVRSDMTHHDDEKEQVFMGINNEMAELQIKFDEAKQNSLRWEIILSRIKISSAEKQLEIGQVKTCCWNLYRQLQNSRPNVADKTQEDLSGQLIEIKDAIRALKRVVHAALERTAHDTETKLAQPEGSNKTVDTQDEKKQQIQIKQIKEKPEKN